MLLCLESLNPVKRIYVTESQMALLVESSMPLNDIYDKYYKDKVDGQTFKRIITSDPTFNNEKGDKMGKYGKWLLSLYIQKKLQLEDLYKVTTYLSAFIKYSSKIQDKDINHYTSLPQLYNVIEPFLDNSISSSKSEDIRRIKEGADKVYEDDVWLVVIPHTKESAIYYGKGTQWCTAAEHSDNMFDSYNEDGNLYININKTKNRKYQFHFESSQFMDEHDDPIDGAILETIGGTKGLMNFYYKRRPFNDYMQILFGNDWYEVIHNVGNEFFFIVDMEHNDGEKEQFLGLLNKQTGLYQVLSFGEFRQEASYGRFLAQIDTDNGWINKYINYYDLKEKKFIFQDNTRISNLGGGWLSSINEDGATLVCLNTEDAKTLILPNIKQAYSLNDRTMVLACYSKDDKLALYSCNQGQYLTDFIFADYLRPSHKTATVIALPLIEDESFVLLYNNYFNIISQNAYDKSKVLNDENDTTIVNMEIGKLKHYNLNQGPMPNHSLHENIAHAKKYISYGKESFDQNTFQPIKNRYGMTKPLNGFWASPVDSDYGWFEFIENEWESKSNSLDKNIQFTINPNANIYVIDSIEDVQNLEPYFIFYYSELDINWESLAKDYDGVFLTSNAANKFRNFVKVKWGLDEYYLSFNSWDVESLCVFNPDIIENITVNQDDGKQERRAQIHDRWSDDMDY